MKHSHDRQREVQRKAAATPPGQAAGASMVQLKRALHGRGYDEQVQFLKPDAEKAETEEQGQSEETGKPKDAQVILSARRGGSPFSKEFWTDLNVGHCWVDVIKPGGRKDSWGYTAKDVRNFPRFQPWKSVDGKVLHPDRSRGATGTLATPIDEDQLSRAEAWAESQGDKYNLFGFDGGHSCATFAKAFYETATGDSAPTGMFGAIIANPNDLSMAMNKRAEQEKQQQGDAEAAATDASDTSAASTSDAR